MEGESGAVTALAGLGGWLRARVDTLAVPRAPQSSVPYRSACGET